jgi:CRISPR-associated protein Cas5, N-terminal domain
MLTLFVEAPFATFRTFAAGSFRPSAGFLTHSAAYGIVLNVAGIEMRYDDGRSAMTLIGRDVPSVEIAIGALAGEDGQFVPPSSATIYQQIHNYPVGATGKERAPLTKGNKYNIVPARRSLLVDLRAYVSIRAGEELEQKVRRGLDGSVVDRYGLPFLGDNNFLPDHLREVADEDRRPTFWYERIDESSAARLGKDTIRLTTTIDRADMSRTSSALFRPTTDARLEIPESAWVTIDYAERH